MMAPRWSWGISPMELVELLNMLYSAFDETILDWGLHKVEPWAKASHIPKIVESQQGLIRTDFQRPPIWMSLAIQRCMTTHVLVSKPCELAKKLSSSWFWRGGTLPGTQSKDHSSPSKNALPPVIRSIAISWCGVFLISWATNAEAIRELCQDPCWLILAASWAGAVSTTCPQGNHNQSKWTMNYGRRRLWTLSFTQSLDITTGWLTATKLVFLCFWDEMGLPYTHKTYM